MMAIATHRRASRKDSIKVRLDDEFDRRRSWSRKRFHESADRVIFHIVR